MDPPWGGPDYKKLTSCELYILNNDGLFILNEDTNTAVSLNGKLSFPREHDLWMDMEIVDDKYLFLVTYGNGLIKVDLQKNTKTFLTLAEGIPSLYLYNSLIATGFNFATATSRLQW